MDVVGPAIQGMDLDFVLGRFPGEIVEKGGFEIRCDERVVVFGSPDEVVVGAPEVPANCQGLQIKEFRQVEWVFAVAKEGGKGMEPKGLPKPVGNATPFTAIGWGDAAVAASLLLPLSVSSPPFSSSR